MTQIAIVVYPRFTALDLVGPYEVLRGLPGADIRFVAHEPGPVVADSGVLAIGATHAFDETPLTLCFVPGGPQRVGRPRRGAAQLAAHSLPWCRLDRIGVHRFRRPSRQPDSWGRRATTHWSSLRLLPMFGAVAVDDERIVGRPTAASPPPPVSPPASTWPLWLAAQVAGEDRARAIQLMIEYDPQPPFDSGQRSKASKSTVAASTALLSRDLIEPTTMADGAVLCLAGHARDYPP